MRPTRYLRLSSQSLGIRLHGRRPVHLLHIGKCAGTALKQALIDAPEPQKYQVVGHTHGVRMEDLPHPDEFFFVVRDPVDRFVSAFVSRQREDAPRFRAPWSPAEAIAFSNFDSPAELGLALADSGTRRADAVESMNSIEHLRTSYWYWFANPAALRRNTRRILWIGLQDSLDAQIPVLAERLGLDSLVLPSDGAAANRSSGAGELPPAARAALTEWYRRDYECLELCREIAARL